MTDISWEAAVRQMILWNKRTDRCAGRRIWKQIGKRMGKQTESGEEGSRQGGNNRTDTEETMKNAAGRRKRAGRRLAGAVLKYLAMALLLLLVNRFVLTVHIVRGQGMYPAIRDGDLLIVQRYPRRFHTGDVVVCRTEEGDVVGRIAALPGETVEIEKNGTVLVDGHPLQEAVPVRVWPAEEEAGNAPAEGPLLVEEEDALEAGPLPVKGGSYFLLGDCRSQGTRQETETGLGERNAVTVQREQILGKAVTVIRRREI